MSLDILSAWFHAWIMKLYYSPGAGFLAFPFILAFIFFTLSAIHIYWGIGGRWGTEAVIPTTTEKQKSIMPGKLATFGVAFGLFALGIFICLKAEWLTLSIPSFISDYGLYAIGFVFLLRAIGEFKYVGFFKRIKNTKFAYYDTRYFSPLCLVVAMLSIAWGVYG
ncbi:MAG: DUF3995 domain-containing protein [Leptospira sp.]|nr:DUF3995 domain-containing protein [Leptospira sp.]